MNATICLSFDNLGEAAELEMGALPSDAPLGDHITATRAVPSILEALAERGLRATFFVEGLNAEAYPELLRRIDAEGHEVAYHAWRHEQWGELSAAEQADNLRRGAAAFERLGLEMSGMRPPGGGLGENGLEVLREAGLEYCSPAGEGAGADRDVALLPFQWRHVDATCLLPGLEPVRREITGSAEPIEPDRLLAHLEAELEKLASEGGFATFVLHPVTIDAWFGQERLCCLLDAVAEVAARSEAQVATCREVAQQVLADAESFAEGTKLDATTWSG